jgi:hypothetical protein
MGGRAVGALLDLDRPQAVAYDRIDLGLLVTLQTLQGVLWVWRGGEWRLRGTAPRRHAGGRRHDRRDNAVGAGDALGRPIGMAHQQLDLFTSHTRTSSRSKPLAKMVRPAGSPQVKWSRTGRHVSSLTLGTPGVACGSMRAPRFTAAPTATKLILS